MVLFLLGEERTVLLTIEDSYCAGCLARRTKRESKKG